MIAALLLATAAAGGAATSAGATSPTTYYVAMGDSLGAGTGASSGANSYVQRLYSYELARMPGLKLKNFSCGGATTSSVINNLSCGSPVTQLARATTFLQAHRGEVAFVTIDIGGNDVDGCGSNTTCIANGLAAINQNLPQILFALKAAYPGVRVYGMNYYDPFLATWITGPAGQMQAQQSVPQADTFNATLTNIYTAAGFPTADVAAAFQTDDFSLTGTYLAQTVPQNVANACNWTHMCDAGDFHANDAGHAVLAQSFEQLIDLPTAPDVPTSVTISTRDSALAAHWLAPLITHGSAITGYVVSPFVGATALTPIVFNSPETTQVITGLTNGTAYRFRVAATNAVGTGAKSITSVAIAAGAPKPPKFASATAGTGSATVTWLAPAADNGAPITGYTITAYVGTTVAQTVSLGLVTQTTMTGLIAGGTYTFAVAAANARGLGPQTPVTNPVTVS